MPARQGRCAASTIRGGTAICAPPASAHRGPVRTSHDVTVPSVAAGSPEPRPRRSHVDPRRAPLPCRKCRGRHLIAPTPIRAPAARTTPSSRRAYAGAVASPTVAATRRSRPTFRPAPSPTAGQQRPARAPVQPTSRARRSLDPVAPRSLFGFGGLRILAPRGRPVALRGVRAVHPVVGRDRRVRAVRAGVDGRSWKSGPRSRAALRAGVLPAAADLHQRLRRRLPLVRAVGGGGIADRARRRAGRGGVTAGCRSGRCGQPPPG